MLVLATNLPRGTQATSQEKPGLQSQSPRILYGLTVGRVVLTNGGLYVSRFWMINPSEPRFHKWSTQNLKEMTACTQTLPDFEIHAVQQLR
jgi:hypothetical protein